MSTRKESITAGSLGFSANDYVEVAVNLHDAEARRLRTRHGLCRDGDVRAAFDVGVYHLGEIHLVELVAGEYEVVEVFSLVTLEMVHVFSHGIRGSLIPASSGICLFGGEDVDETLPERIEFIGLLDMFVERSRVELGEQVYVVISRIYAVAYRNVHEPVLPRERNRRLAAVFCQGIEARPAPAAHDYADYVVSCHISEF